MARVLVIGGTLFVGRSLVEQLLARGDDITVMHRGLGTPYGTRVGEVRCDRNDTEAVKTVLSGERFDVVYDNVFDWSRGTNAEQVRTSALAVASGLGRYVFTSSVAVYPPGGVYDEDSPLVPSDYPNSYGALKADSERALFALERDKGIPVTTLRPAFIYGPHNAFYREAFFWDRLLAGRPIVIPDDGTATMQWVSVTDVARAAILAGETKGTAGRAYNLAEYPPITQLDFVRLMARAAGTEATFAHIPRERIAALGGGLMAPPFYFGVFLDIPAITVSADRARKELGLELTPLEDGMRATFQWYKEQQRAPADFTWDDKALSDAQ